MANYNKYINTFQTSGETTDLQEWDTYIDSEAAGFPNVAYLETSDMVKYRKFSQRVPYGTILYDDLSITLPTESIDTTKEPLAMLCVEKSEALDHVPRWFLTDGVIISGYTSLNKTLMSPKVTTPAQSTLSFPSGYVKTNSTDLTNSELWNGAERTELIYGANSGDTQMNAATFAHNYNLEHLDTTVYVPAIGELATAFSSIERFLYFRTRLEAINTAYGTTKVTTLKSIYDYTSPGFTSSNFYDESIKHMNRYLNVKYINNSSSSYPLTTIAINTERYDTASINAACGLLFLKIND
jgi:hypothetical protein